MNTPIDDELLHLKHKVIDDIDSFMKLGGAESEADPDYDPQFDAGYDQGHVDECDQLLSKFLRDARADEGAEDSVLMKHVEHVVLALNSLDEKCGFSLIETDQREAICKLIDRTMTLSGMTPVDDCTEEWREW